MTEEQEEVSQEELDEILKQIGGSGSPYPSEKQNLVKLFTDVIKSKDTTKSANLKGEEIGLPVLPLRTYKELALFSRNIAGMDYCGDYFNAMGEITSSTSLSREGFLLRLAVTTKKELADVSPKKENKGWFKSKDEGGGQQQ